jgi:predicted transposase YdaD
VAEADKVFRIDEPEPWLLHLELQVSYDAALPGRMLLYSVLLSHRHSLPVRSVAILLRPKSDGPAMSGSIRHSIPSSEPYLEFRYETLRLWQLPVDSIMAAGVGALPLAPLAAGAAVRLEDVIDRMDHRIRADVQSAEVADLWAATYVLLGLSYSREVGEAVRRRVRTMEESVTYQEILSKGERKGEAKGIIEGARRILLTFGAKRLGPPSPEALDVIGAIRDFDRLERLTERVPDASGWDDLLHED